MTSRRKKQKTWMPVIRHEPIKDNTLESYTRQDFPHSIKPIVFHPTEENVIGPEDVISGENAKKKK